MIPYKFLSKCITQSNDAKFKEMNIAPQSYYRDEGKFSMFWDVVNNKVGPSSYSRFDEMVKIGYNIYEEGNLPTIDDLPDIFAKW